MARYDPPTGLVSRFTDGHHCESDAVMFALGREPYVEGLGLESAGVKLGANGAVLVDDHSRTSVENIWAVGDVTNRIKLTPLATPRHRYRGLPGSQMRPFSELSSWQGRPMRPQGRSAPPAA